MEKGVYSRKKKVTHVNAMNAHGPRLMKAPGCGKGSKTHMASAWLRMAKM
ncbi:hypothetical protein ABEW05_008526 [Botrytis cinerea]